MARADKPKRQNRTLTVDFHDQATYFELLSDGKAFVEFVLAFIFSLGFQLAHKWTCDGGSLTRHSHDARVRLGGLTIWRIQCASCKAVFTVLPYFVLRYRRMRPDVARQALLATHGGLSLEWCATICHISPMALYRLLCALGQHSLVSVRLKCHLPLPAYILVDEKHSKCLPTFTPLAHAGKHLGKFGNLLRRMPPHGGAVWIFRVWGFQDIGPYRYNPIESTALVAFILNPGIGEQASECVLTYKALH